MNHTNTFDYVGKDELLLLEHIPNYNKYIASLFAGQIEPTQLGRARVFDFGAGIGTISLLFSALTGILPVAVEPDPVQRAILRERGLECCEHIDHLPELEFDLVISSNVLEHIDDDVGTLQAIRRRLKPGGVAAFWVPALPMLWSEFDNRVGHRRRYTVQSLQQVFKAAGFKVVDAKYHDSVGFIVSVLFKWLGNREGKLDPVKLRIFDRWCFPMSKHLDKAIGRSFGKNVFINALRID